MGVKGLTKYLSNYPESFKSTILHDTYVVIDYCNFISHVSSKIQSQYTGENLNYFSKLSKLILDFKKCKVDPIFISDGCHAADNIKINELIGRRIRMLTTLKSIKNKRCSSEDPDMNIGCNPVLVHMTNFKYFKELNIKFLSIASESDAESSAIAAYLGCPVISGDSDFFCFNHSIEVSDGYKFIPLNFFEYDIIPLDFCSCSPSCTELYGLEVKYFSKSTSPLKDIPQTFFPFLSVIAGNDWITPFLPTKVFNNMNVYPNEPNKPSFNQRKFESLIKWLTKNVSNPEKMLKEFIDSQPPFKYSNHDLIELITISFLQYNLPTKLIAEIYLPKLGLKFSSEHKLKSDLIVNRNEKSFSSLLCFLKGGFPDTYNHSDIIKCLPDNFVKSFEAGAFNTGLLDSLYTNNGIILGLYYEDTEVSKTAFIGRLFRKLFYGIILDIEDDQLKLCGLQFGRVKEYYCEQNSVFCGILRVERIPITSMRFTFSKLLEEYGNFTSAYMDTSSPAWINVLVIVNSYHYAGTNCHNGDLELFYDVFVLCSISSHLNVLCEKRNHVQAISRCAEIFTSLTESLLTQDHLDFWLNTVLIELQNLYTILRDLCFICNLFGAADNFFDFTSSELMFPSGKIMHLLFKLGKQFNPEYYFKKLLFDSTNISRAIELFDEVKYKRSQLKCLAFPSISQFFNILFFVAFLFINFIDGTDNESVVTIEGLVNISNQAEKSDWPSKTRVHVDGGLYLGLVYQNGTFFVRGIPFGSSYLVEVLHPQYIFPPIRLDINSKGKIRARQVNNLRPSEVVPVSHTPLVFITLGKAQFFIPREKLRTLDMLMEPSILIMVVLFAMVLLLPRLVDTNDPELQQMSQMMSNTQNVPSLSEMMSNLLGPNSANQRQGTGSNRVSSSNSQNYNKVPPGSTADTNERRTIRR